MNLERFKQFKSDSDILIEASQWLTSEIDNIIQENYYYQDNPHLDTYDNMMNRFNRMDELEVRSSIEEKHNHNHRIKYSDMYEGGGDIC